MAEYIERETLIKHIERSFGEISTPFVVKEIKDFPTADVVEVVRCKNCENYNIFGCADGFGWCESFHNGVTDEHYCRHGKRRCEE